MDINIIAAIGKNYELGKNGSLVWRFKEDMNFFKNITMNHPVVMGRKTFESLPNILPGRKNIVISTSEIIDEKIELYKSIKEFLINYKDYNDEVFIIGGSSIYEQFIELSNKMYITEIDAIDKESDVYFPKFNINNWNREVLDSHQENSINFKHVLYKKKR